MGGRARRRISGLTKMSLTIVAATAELAGSRSSKSSIPVRAARPLFES
jgi:hypothetical protein